MSSNITGQEKVYAAVIRERQVVSLANALAEAEQTTGAETQTYTNHACASSASGLNDLVRVARELCASADQSPTAVLMSMRTWCKVAKYFQEPPPSIKTHRLGMVFPSFVRRYVYVTDSERDEMIRDALRCRYRLMEIVE